MYFALFVVSTVGTLVNHKVNIGYSWLVNVYNFYSQVVEKSCVEGV